MCGECCKNLEKSNVYSHLHSGDGVCIYFDKENNACNIYENRPDICNVDLAYKIYFSGKLSKEDYYNLNYEGCRILWKKRKNIKVP